MRSCLTHLGGRATSDGPKRLLDAVDGPVRATGAMTAAQPLGSHECTLARGFERTLLAA